MNSKGTGVEFPAHEETLPDGFSEGCQGDEKNGSQFTAQIDSRPFSALDRIRCGQAELPEQMAVQSSHLWRCRVDELYEAARTR